YSIQRDNGYDFPENAPRAWQFQSSDDGTTWTTRDSRSNQTGWAVAERRVFSLPEADTGTVSAHRYWRFNFTETNGGWLTVAEVELFGQSVSSSSSSPLLNATAIGTMDRRRKRVIVDTGDNGIE